MSPKSRVRYPLTYTWEIAMSDMSFSFDDDEDVEVEETGGKQKDNPMKQLRDALKAAQRELKEAKKELAPLREFKTTFETEQKVAGAAKSFEKFGLTPKHAELFLKLNPETEVSDDIIKNFATEYSLPLKSSDDNEESLEAGLPSNTPFVPADAGVDAEGGFMNRDQLDALYKTNPQKALQVLKSGRVRWNNQDDN